MNGRIRSTLHAWAWPFILAAFARGVDGVLAEEDLTDRFLFDIAQIDAQADDEDLDGSAIALCYVSAGLLLRTEKGYALSSVEVR